jgi:predicted AlkP superfamily phosphohydrolase/phosphomutase
LKEIIKLETDFTIEMAESFNWDLIFVVFMVTDRIIHLFAGNYEVLVTVYEAMDEAVGRLIQLIDLDNDQIFITSDHGTTIYKKGYPIPAFLRKQKLLYLKPSIRKRTILSSMVKELLKDRLETISSFIDFDINVLFNRLKLYKRVKGKGIVDTPKVTLHSLIDTKKSPLLYYGEHSGIDVLLKINERLYSKDHKQQMLEQIVRNINQEKNIIKRTWVSEELYSGPELCNAPDLILEMYDDLSAIETPLSYYQKPQVVPTLKGGHLRRGIFIASGKAILPNRQRGVAEIFDIAPTILYTLGLSIPKDIDGKVLSNLYSKNYYLIHPPKYMDIDTKKRSEKRGRGLYTPEEEEGIKKRLQKLGYI